ncbi:MAG: hypothetical protein AAF750_10160 [Planctomycetota bacterium]
MLALRPFLDPLPIEPYATLLVLPLVIVIAVVYKTLKGHPPKQLPREAGLLVLQILLFLAAAYGLLVLIEVFA